MSIYVSDAKDYLSGLIRTDKRIEWLMEQRERYEALAMRRTASYSSDPSGGRTQNSAVEYFTLRLVEVDRELNAEIDKLVDTRRDIKYMIDLLDDEAYRDVLTLHYDNGWKLDRVAKAMDYSHDRIKHMHGEALLEIAKVYAYYYPDGHKTKKTDMGLFLERFDPVRKVSTQ